ncbi:SER/THR protein kinase [Pigeonpox virus]|uniref:Serine/threonine-protein kinase n=1 Tax=Pigeonpox virus TaxID=10264 RepID=A0A068EEK6_9POXV|nr:SER/THR protein kinase [Pigeonpox virus]AID46621.1 SER/THR protein kinase [Pigeonpox virus]WCL40062.1 SER/THR protein kinase [Pigeonpox virus]
MEFPDIHTYNSDKYLEDGDTVILGDTIQFQFIYENIDNKEHISLPKIKIFKYFRDKISFETLDRIIKNDYINPSYYQLKDKKFCAYNRDFYHLSTGGYGIIFRMEKYVVKFVFEDGGKKYKPMEVTSEFTIPRFLYNNLKGDERKFIVCAIAMGINFKIDFLRTIYYNTMSLMSALFNIMEGEPLENKYSHRKVLRYFAKYKQSNDFVKLISQFYPYVVNSNINVINNFNYLINFFERSRRSNGYFNRGNIIIFPLAKCSAEKITPDNYAQYGFSSIVEYTKFMFLQIALLYIKIYELPCSNFVHLDLKPDNILIFDSKESINIYVGDTHYVFKEPIRCTLNDFDFSQISEIIPNKKTVTAINKEQNWYYDFHFFSHVLFKVYPEISKDEEFASLLNEFTICDKSICENFRLQVNKLPSISFLINIVSRDIFSKWIDGISTSPQ